MCLPYQRGFVISRFFLISFYDWGKENRLLYRGLHRKTCQCCSFPQAGLLLRFQVAGYTRLHVQLVGGEMNSNKFLLQGSKQVPSSSPGQVDFLAGQVTFKTHLPNEGQDN